MQIRATDGLLNREAISFILENINVYGYYDVVGGFIGYDSESEFANISLIDSNIFAEESTVGGLVGENYGSTFTNISIINTFISGYSDAGGIVGDIAGGSISNSMVENLIFSVGNNVGGLVGSAAWNVNISDSNSYTNVSGENYVGGFVGYGPGLTLNNVYFDGNIIATGQNIGGLIGYAGSFSGGPITNSYAVGNVSGKNYVGGLVGDAQISITNSYFDGNIITTGYNVGGLVGNYNNSIITKCYSIGNISGTNNVGGLIGNNDGGNINNSYFLGNISGDNSVGGLIGSTVSYVTIEKLYFGKGTITATNTYGDGSVGAIIGNWMPSTVTSFNNIYFNNTQGLSGIGKDPCGCGTTALEGVSGKIEGKIPNQLKQESTFENWDFSTIWGVDEGNSFPYLLTNQQDPFPSE